LLIKNRHYIPGGSPDWSAEKIENLMANHCPLGRCAVPEDVARVVAFLASEDGCWVNGQSHFQLNMHVRVLTVPRPSHHHLWRFFAVDCVSHFLFFIAQIEACISNEMTRYADHEWHGSSTCPCVEEVRCRQVEHPGLAC
jgi:hypothetical protein